MFTASGLFAVAAVPTAEEFIECVLAQAGNRCPPFDVLDKDKNIVASVRPLTHFAGVQYPDGRKITMPYPAPMGA